MDHESVDRPSHQGAGDQPANGGPNERNLVTFRHFFFQTRRKKLIHLLPAYRLARATPLISIKTLAALPPRPLGKPCSQSVVDSLVAFARELPLSEVFVVLIHIKRASKRLAMMRRVRLRSASYDGEAQDEWMERRDTQRGGGQETTGTGYWHKVVRT